MALGGLAAGSLWLSALPKPLAAVAGAVALAWSWRLARREAAKPGCTLAWKGGEDQVCVNFGGRGEVWSRPRALLRGPMAVFSAVDAGGQRRHLLWWPDTLHAHGRRRLRLASSADARPAPLPELF
jgi:hypothetical protein